MTSILGPPLNFTSAEDHLQQQPQIDDGPDGAIAFGGGEQFPPEFPGECQHYVVQSPDPTNSALAIAFFCALYTHIFVLGLLGNLAIVFLTLRCQHLRSVQNIFILNLAISDVIVCLLCLPFTLVTNIYKEWLFGSAICHLLPMVQAVSVLVSTFSLSAIAIDRYWLVHYPHARSLTPGQATILASVLWALSLLISLPYAYYMTLEEYEGYCGEFCSEQWPNTQVRRGYALAVLALQFLLPFLTMSFCYASIFSRLRRRNNFKLRRLTERQKMLAKHSGSANNFDGVEKSPSVEGLCRAPSRSESDRMRANELSKQQRRTTSILASVVLFFGLAWLPHNVLTMVIEYDIQLLQWGGTNYLYLLSIASHSLAMTTNVANPILYAWLNPTFKEMFLRTANPLLLRRKMRRNGGQVNQMNNQQLQQQQQQQSSVTQSKQSKSRPSSAQTSSLGEGRLLVHVNNGGERGNQSPKGDFF